MGHRKVPARNIKLDKEQRISKTTDEILKAIGYNKIEGGEISYNYKQLTELKDTLRTLRDYCNTKFSKKKNYQ